MRLRRGLLAACSAVLVTATGCASFAESAGQANSSAASAAASEAPGDQIDWSRCTSQRESLIKKCSPGADRDRTFDCGRTDVPIHYDDPPGDTLPLFLVPATLGDPKD